MRIENIVPLLAVPSLRKLEHFQVCIMERDYEDDRRHDWDTPGYTVSDMLPTSSSRLESLALRESFIRTDILNPTFDGIQNLKSFAYEHTDDEIYDNYDDWDEDIDLDVLAKSLSKHPIESLDLSNEDPISFGDSFLALISAIPTLKT